MVEVEVVGALGGLLGMIEEEVALRRQFVLPLGSLYSPSLVVKEGPPASPSQPGFLCPAGSWSG